MMASAQNKMITMYERDDFGSYLIIKPQIDKLIRYQVEMLANNRISGILAMDLRCKNNENYLYYKVTSKISLSQLLSRKKLDKLQLLNLLNQITEIMILGTNYLLYNKCYILEEEFIYVNPATLELYMVYLPVIRDEDVNENLRKLIIDLIINANYAENGDATGDGFIQRVINYLKEDTFNISGLNRLLKQLSGDITVKESSNKASSLAQDINKSENSEFEILQDSSRDKDNKLDRLKHLKLTDSKVYSLNFKLLAIGIIAQFLLLGGFLFSRKFLESLGGNIKTTYGAILLIIIAIDALLIKNLLDRKKDVKDFDNKITSDDFPEDPDDNTIHNTDFSTTHNIINNTVTDDENKTVILSKKKELGAYLINMNGGMKEEILINKEDFLIGRLEDMVDYVIRNNAIGKVHAHITMCENKYYLKDLNTANGTLINDVKLECSTENEIKDGDRITFANIDYIFALR